MSQQRTNRPGGARSTEAPLQVDLRSVVTIGGPVVAFVVAWGTSGVHDDLGAINVALLLAMITVGVGLVSWIGGLVTSVVSALALNFFHTEPVHTLRVSDASDLLAVALLGALGIGVSAITALRVRAIARSTVVAGASAEAQGIRNLGGASSSVNELWMRTVAAVAGQLSLVDVRLEPIGDTGRSSIARRRWTEGDDEHTLVLPEGGAVVAFTDPRLELQVLLTPRSGLGALTLDRRAVFAFVDQLELALEQHH